MGICVSFSLKNHVNARLAITGMDYLPFCANHLSGLGAGYLEVDISKLNVLHGDEGFAELDWVTHAVIPF